MLRNLRTAFALALSLGVFAAVWSVTIAVGAAITMRSVWPIQSLTPQLAWDTFWTRTSWEGWSGDISWVAVAIGAVLAVMTVFMTLRASTGLARPGPRGKTKTTFQRGARIAPNQRLEYCKIIT